MIVQKVIAYGCIGLLVEVIFTGLWSVFHKDFRGTSTTYLWMLPIYGLGGLQMDALHSLHWHPFLLAAMYVPVIYANEFLWGALLDFLLGKCPWDYGRGRHTIMGYIRLDYAPLWLALALSFEMCVGYIQRMLSVINTVL
jgi:uncharacterized membrane protein